MNKESLIDKLIEAYINGCRKRGEMKIPASTDKTHKNYKYFEKVIDMYGSVPDFDPYVFAEANLMDQIRYPAQLSTKVAFSRFRAYKEKLNADNKGPSKEDVLLQAFKNTKETIEAKMGEYNPVSFFSCGDSDMSPGLAMFIKGLISPHYCMVCKPFWEKIRILDPDLSQLLNFEDLKVKRAFISSLNTRAKSKLKKIVGEEYWV